MLKFIAVLGANDAEYFAEICRDLASNLKTTQGRVMCSAQEEMLDVCESLLEQSMEFLSHLYF